MSSHLTHIANFRKKIPEDYVKGSSAFLDYEFIVDERVLCPRPETEELVLLAEKIYREKGFSEKEPCILDAGCGSGCIGLSLLLRNPDLRIVLADLSSEALEVAQENACRLLPSRSLKKVSFVQGDLKKELFQPASFSAILCNPPYIARSEWHLVDEAVFAEPQLAWDGGEKGLDFILPFLPYALKWLKEEGFLLMEIGFAQHSLLYSLWTQAFQKVTLYYDLASHPRYLLGHRKKNFG